MALLIEADAAVCAGLAANTTLDVPPHATGVGPGR